MGYGVAFLVFLSISAAVFSKTIYDGFKEEEKEDDNYELGPFGYSENETNETAPATPAPQLPLAINISGILLPICENGELMFFDGMDFVCVEIPERNCQCPGPVEPTVTEEPPSPFQPPTGCTVFDPPEGGAFVCLLIEDVQIYCSVMCTDESEFSSFPLNPYTCGVLTNFKWINSLNRTQSFLPDCSGFRYSLRPVHLEENYLPSNCNELSEGDAEAVMMSFCSNLLLYFTFDITECADEDVFIQCGD